MQKNQANMEKKMHFTNTFYGTKTKQNNLTTLCEIMSQFQHKFQRAAILNKHSKYKSKPNKIVTMCFPLSQDYFQLN